MKIKLLLTAVALMLSTGGYAQKAAVKTNTLHWATATPNLAFEFGMGEKTSLEFAGGWNPWKLSDNKQLRHYIIQPEFRWWFCERFNRSFLGLHIHGGEFNAGGVGPFKKIKNNRYEGYFYGGGISYGYQWILGTRWGLEAELGVGYARFEYDRFRCGKCGPKIEGGHLNYYGPTRASLSFVYYMW